MYIMKPVSLQFMTTRRIINFVLPFSNLIVGVVIMPVSGWKKPDIEVIECFPGRKN